METGVEHETPSLAWNNSDQRAAHTARTALPYMLNQVDAGVNCPLTMTYAAVAAMQHTPELAGKQQNASLLALAVLGKSELVHDFQSSSCLC